MQLLKKENEREKLARSKLSADDPNYIESSASSEPTRSLGDSSKAQEGGVAALNDDELNEIEEVYQAIEDVSQSLLGAMDGRGLWASAFGGSKSSQYPFIFVSTSNLWSLPSALTASCA